MAPSPDHRYRLLVVAAEPLDDPALVERDRRDRRRRASGRSAGARPELRVVAPAPVLAARPLGLRPAPRPATPRSGPLAVSLASLAAAGLDATGRVGDGDPVQAVEDELRGFAGPRGRARRRARARRRRGRGGAPPPRPAGQRLASGDRCRAARRSRRPCAPSASRSRARRTPAAQLRRGRSGSRDLAHRGGEPADARQIGGDARLRPPAAPAADQEPVLAVADHLVHRRVVVGDHRQPERHRLVQVQAEALPAARRDADVGRGEQPQVLVGRQVLEDRPRPAGRARRRARAARARARPGP